MDASGVTVDEQRYYPYAETRLTTGTIFTDSSCPTPESFALTILPSPAILPVIEVDFYGAQASFVLEQSHVWYEASRASQRGPIFLSH